MYTEEYFRQRVLADEVVGFILIVIITFLLWTLLLTWCIDRVPKSISKNTNIYMAIEAIPYLYILYKFTVFWFN